MARWKVCSFPNCPEFVQGSTRCEEHTVIRPDNRASASERGYDGKWAKVSRDYRKRHPFCMVVGCSRPSTDVDHIDNLGPLGPRGYDESNFQALCHQHHSAKTAATTHAARKKPVKPPYLSERPPDSPAYLTGSENPADSKRWGFRIS